MMKLSATVTLQQDTAFAPFPADEMDRALSWIRESGWDGLEAAICSPQNADAAVIRRIRALGLSVPTVATGQAAGRDNLSLTAPDAARRKAARVRLHEDIDFAHAIGSAYITVGSLKGTGRDTTRADALQWLADALEELLSYARPAGVGILLEPLNRYESSLLCTVGETRAFLDTRPQLQNVSILYDTFHANIEEKDMTASLSKHISRIGHVHVADSHRGLPGDGHIDFCGIARVLQQTGYAGFVSLEALNTPDSAYIRANAVPRLRALFS